MLITDFNGILFNDGSGYDLVKAIHLGIKERAEAIGNTALTGGKYADEWDTTTKIYTSDPLGESDEEDDGRTYLKDVLQGFYDDIVALTTYLFQAPKAFVNNLYPTDGGDLSDVLLWSESRLVTDIGMGAFADLLTGPSNYEPFLWLHEALNRLVWVRETVRLDLSAFPAPLSR